MINQTKLSEAFRRERKRRGLSLTQVGDEIGSSASTLCRFENGDDRTDVSTLARIASWLNMPLSDGAIVVYPKNTLDAILDVIRADDNVTDKDALCELFSVCYKGMVKI